MRRQRVRAAPSGVAWGARNALDRTGHSPGHASLLVYSGGEQALVLGDVFAHPAQVTEPTWNIHFDADKEQASFTRAQLLDWLEADGITVAAGHIPGSGFGRVVREEGRRHWLPLGEVSGRYFGAVGGERGGVHQPQSRVVELAGFGEKLYRTGGLMRAKTV